MHRKRENEDRCARVRIGKLPVRVELARVGAVCVDSLQFSESGTAAQADSLRAHGADCVFGYLGVITPERVGHVLNARMALMPITVGGAHDGPLSVQQLHALGIPPHPSVWLDIEGLAEFADVVLASKIAAWCSAILAASFMPAGYLGSPQPFTSDEQWRLPVQRYMRGQGSIRDRHGDLAEPTRCGWCVTQMYPSVNVAGVDVDFSMVGADYLGRVPSWVVA